MSGFFDGLFFGSVAGVSVVVLVLQAALGTIMSFFLSIYTFSTSMMDLSTGGGAVATNGAALALGALAWAKSGAGGLGVVFNSMAFLRKFGSDSGDETPFISSASVIRSFDLASRISSVTFTCPGNKVLAISVTVSW